MDAITYYKNGIDSPSKLWYSALADLTNKKVPESLAKAIRNHSGKNYFRKGVLIDLGGGTGSSAYHFTNQLPVKKCIIIDGAEVLLEYAKSRKDNFSSELYVQEKNLCIDDLGIDTNSVHIAICCNVMHFLRNIEKVFSEASRVLKKNGYFGFNPYVFAEYRSQVRIATADIPGAESKVEIAAFLYQERYIKSLCCKYRFEEVSTEYLTGFLEPNIDLEIIEKLILLKKK
jgi:ubiquinone/menaquinone biosynthesis C-methylase UbiE